LESLARCECPAGGQDAEQSLAEVQVMLSVTGSGFVELPRSGQLFESVVGDGLKHDHPRFTVQVVDDLDQAGVHEFCDRVERVVLGTGDRDRVDRV
jgi:hypothetical protein